eukprot:jgi/Phyca11/108295/e_gw1.15.106.1
MSSRVKQVFQRYGRTALLFHSTVFMATLTGSYVAIQQGADIQPLAKRVPFVDLTNIDHDTGSFALAYISAIATGPVRCALTITASPVLARFLVRSRSAANKKR